MSPVSSTPWACAASSAPRTETTFAAASAYASSAVRSGIGFALAIAAGNANAYAASICSEPFSFPFSRVRMIPSRRPPLPICSG